MFTTRSRGADRLAAGQRLRHEHEISAPHVGRRIVSADKRQPRVGKHRPEIRRRVQEQLGKVDDDAGRVREQRLELIREAAPAGADLAHDGTLALSERWQHTAALHPDQHLEELQRIDIEEPSSDVEPESPERRRLRDEQPLAAKLAQRVQPRLEVFAPVVALGAIVVRTNAGDMKRVVAKLAEDERRGLDHVIDRLELLAPVRARRRRTARRAAGHLEHRLARALVGRLRALRLSVHGETIGRLAHVRCCSLAVFIALSASSRSFLSRARAAILSALIARSRSRFSRPRAALVSRKSRRRTIFSSSRSE